ALLSKAHGPIPENLRQSICEKTLPLLEKALDRHPDDVPAWEAKGFALGQLNQPAEALKALDAALARAPRGEQALKDALRVALASGASERALAYGKRLLQVNPGDADGHVSMAQLLGKRRRFSEAIRECREALRLDPSLIEVRKTLITCCI